MSTIILCVGRFGVRFREHVNSTRSSKPAVGDHLRNTRHVLDLSSSSIVVRENDNFKRRIREAIEIHCQAPTLNRDVRYELPAIYRDVLSWGKFEQHCHPKNVEVIEVS